MTWRTHHTTNLGSSDLRHSWEFPRPPGGEYIQITPERVAPAERAAGLATRANMPSDSSKAEAFCRSSRCDAARAGDVTPLIFCNRKDEGGYGLDAGGERRGKWNVWREGAWMKERDWAQRSPGASVSSKLGNGPNYPKTACV
eukprot:scaffold5790_cov63-Phaeocystis_antarctica.AAC.4